MGANHTYINGICFFVEIGLFDYADAMVNCQSQFGTNSTGKLFEPRDRSTNDQVIQFAKNKVSPNASVMPVGTPLHIGINDIATEGTWQYATGGDLVYTNWDNNLSDHSTIVNGGALDCGVTWTNTTWNDGYCNKPRASICEMV